MGIATKVFDGVAGVERYSSAIEASENIAYNLQFLYPFDNIQWYDVLYQKFCFFTKE